MEEKTNLKQIFNELKQSPIFSISLSSKELFHSNFWAWLIDYNKEYARVFFDDIDHQNISKISREEKHRDLTLYVNEKIYIIENKIKSLPTEEQLIRYQDNEKNFYKGCLTGVVKLDKLPHKWDFISYGKIGDSIREINDKHKFDKWYFVIEEYTKVIKNIEKLVVEFNEHYGNKLICWDEYKNDSMLGNLEDIRFADVCKKYKANEFVNYLNNNLKVELESLIEENSENNIVLFINSWFSNKSSLIDVRFIKNKDTDNQLVVGIQIQDNQYRFCVERRKGTLNFKAEKTFDCLFEEFLIYGWFENYDNSKKIFKNRKTSMRDLYCKYNSTDYKFVYQYYILNDDDLMFENLALQIKKNMANAANIIKDISK